MRKKTRSERRILTARVSGDGLSNSPSESVRRSLKDWLSRFGGREATVAIALPVAIIVVSIVFGTIEPRFLDIDNWLNIGRQGAALALLAMGLGLVMIGGGLDLSIGSTMGLASVLAAMSSSWWGTVPGYVVGIVVGLLVGLCNGVLIAGAGIPPFIATIGMLSAVRGIALLITDGISWWQVSPEFDYLGVGTVLSIPVSVVVVMLVLACLWALMRFLRFGTHVYAVGGDARATWLAGVNVRWLQYRLYLISGALAGAVGVLVSSRINSGQPTLGAGMELNTVAAVLIGGVSLGGGAGSIVRVVAAALFLTILGNGLNLTGVQSFWQSVMIGVVIAVAAMVDAYRSRGISVGRFIASLFVDVRSRGTDA